MTFTRRQLLASGISAALVAGTSGQARANVNKNTDEFDINSAFATFTKDLGRNVDDAGGSVTFTGKDPMVRSHFRIGASMAIPAMGAALGAAAVWRDRTGEGQDLKVDLRESLYNVMPVMAFVKQASQAAGLIPKDDPVANSFTFTPNVNGLIYQAPFVLGNPLSFAIYETKDDRYVTPTGLYPQHLYGFLNIVDAAPNPVSIAKAIKKWNAADLDDAVGEAGMVMGLHRTRKEWAQEPQSKYVDASPLIEIVKVADSDPIPYALNPSQPLSGIRTLTATHVIAGTCAARTLAEYGSEVLHIARDQALEHEILVQDVNVGMRSSFLNLRDADHKAKMQALLPQTDVFIESFRGRAMERLGFGVEDVAVKTPGKIYLSMRCYGWDGPWRDRAGFDMEALAVTGFTMEEGGGERPRFPPTMVLNDYIAGYLGATGVIEALRRRAKEGGSYHVRISLARAAVWYASHGQFTSLDFNHEAPDHRMIDPETIKAQTPYGEIHRLAPQVKLSRTPGKWRSPLVAVRGGDLPVWLR